MKNSELIKFTIQSVITATIMIACVMTLGMFVPMIVCIIASICSEKVFLSDCIISTTFVVFSIFGTFIACIYLGDKIQKQD